LKLAKEYPKNLMGHEDTKVTYNKYLRDFLEVIESPQGKQLLEYVAKEATYQAIATEDHFKHWWKDFVKELE
jgi:hypothetical protein